MSATLCLPHTDVILVSVSAGYCIIVADISKGRGHLYRQRSIVGADRISGLVEQSLVDNRKAIVATLLHTTARCCLHLEDGGKATVDLVHTIFFKEDRVTHVCDRPGERSV